MATNEKTPLQAVVSVLCDALCELPIEDRPRALEAIHVTLGIPGSAHNPRPALSDANAAETFDLLAQLLASLRDTQAAALRNALDMSQQILLVEIADRVMPMMPNSTTPATPTTTMPPTATMPPSPADPKTTDYCSTCGESPESASHGPFADSHPYATA